MFLYDAGSLFFQVSLSFVSLLSVFYDFGLTSCVSSLCPSCLFFLCVCRGVFVLSIDAFRVFLCVSRCSRFVVLFFFCLSFSGFCFQKYVVFSCPRVRRCMLATVGLHESLRPSRAMSMFNLWQSDPEELDDAIMARDAEIAGSSGWNRGVVSRRETTAFSNLRRRSTETRSHTTHRLHNKPGTNPDSDSDSGRQRTTQDH